ncbi:MAG: stage 0 sporulation family protein [Clostridiales Family XIII bacterium]|jgi:cell fate regulator YaaT (PSP1 superfamily)|nr:stage 0 sporulation family protein [Clostridiales Family XIII bacterium]
MVRVASVGFRTSSKPYYFDPGDLALRSGEHVIVETSKGQEYGTVKGEVRDISENDFGKSLKKIIRKATQADKDKNADHIAGREDAMKICKEKIRERELEMKLIDAEFTFDGSKVIFYFTSDNRVDFRVLVKDLAGTFRKRIELRQVGVRDEAKLLGGIGSCGRGLCCSEWLRDFEPVSIKMAKVQNLSLNPTKISGCCGRLMCCLKYENDVYQEMRKGMPNQGEYIMTPEGRGRVMDTSILLSQVKIRLVTEERSDDASEKLSSDLYIFRKDEIKRLGKQGGGQNSGGGKNRNNRNDKNRNSKGNKEINKQINKEIDAEIRNSIADEIIDEVVE